MFQPKTSGHVSRCAAVHTKRNRYRPSTDLSNPPTDTHTHTHTHTHTSSTCPQRSSTQTFASRLRSYLLSAQTFAYFRDSDAVCVLRDKSWRLSCCILQTAGWTTRCSVPRAGNTLVPSPRRPNQFCSPNNLKFNWRTELLPQGLKRPRQYAQNLLLPSTAAIENKWRYASTTLYQIYKQPTKRISIFVIYFIHNILTTCFDNYYCHLHGDVIVTTIHNVQMHLSVSLSLHNNYIKILILIKIV